MKEDRIYLLYILECIQRIEENTKDGWDCFMASHTLQDAVLRNLQTMAESTQRLSDTLKETKPKIEWRLIAAFRNTLVHNYLGINMEIIWRVIQNDIPVLKQAIISMLEPKP